MLRVISPASSKENQVDIAVVRPEGSRFMQSSDQWPGWAQTRSFDSVLELVQAADSGFSPAIILVYQSHSDQYLCSDRDQLFGRFPLSRIVVVLGSLCPGEGRTRSFWPISVLVEDSAIKSRLTLERDVILGRIPALPLTASVEERARFSLQGSKKDQALESSSYVVVSPDAAWREMVVDQLGNQNQIQLIDLMHDQLDQNSVSETSVILLDLDPPTSEHTRRIRETSDIWSKGHPVGFSSWISGGQQALASELGIEQLHSKLEIPVSVLPGLS